MVEWDFLSLFSENRSKKKGNPVVEVDDTLLLAKYKRTYEANTTQHKTAPRRTHYSLSRLYLTFPWSLYPRQQSSTSTPTQKEKLKQPRALPLHRPG